MPTYFRPARVDITEDGGGLPIALLVMAGAAVMVVSAVLAVIAFILGHLLLIISAAVALAGAGVAVLVRLRCYVIPREAVRPAQIRRTALRPHAAARASAPPRQAAIGAPAQHLHIHLHGVSPDDIAALLRQSGTNHRPVEPGH